MRSMAFLHVGDVHFPELDSRPGLGDNKDTTFPPALAAGLIPNRSKKVADAIRGLLQSQSDLRGVLLSGDLTTRGKLDGYRECVSYLERVLDWHDTRYWKRRLFVVVPGNHDIDRIDPGAPPADLLAKFIPLADVWNAAGKPRFFYEHANGKVVKASGCTSVVFPLNTCVGCGDYRFLPDPVRNDIAATLHKYGASLDDVARFELLGERLDTPAILAAHIEQIATEIRTGCNNAAVFILGHHPLLPQPTPRIDVYTELVNAGHFRSCLLNLDRKVVYLHGHIHQDPIEVISDPVRRRGKVISVSAPELRDGFNLLRVFFTSGRNTPLGIEVTPYRFGYHPSLQPLQPIRIGLVRNSDSWSETFGDVQEEVLRLLSSPSMTLRFDDLHVEVKKRVLVLPQKQLALELQHLEWLGFIHIDNREDHSMHWQLRRLTP